MKSIHEPHEKEPDHQLESERFLCEMEAEFLIHELKDPLAVIESGMELLLKKPDKFGPYSTVLQKILNRTLRNSRKASHMLYGLLEVGRSQEGQFVITDISPSDLVLAVLSESLELLPHNPEKDVPDNMNSEDMHQVLEAQGIHVEISQETYQSKLLQDEVKIRQITGNLIKNALHYMNESLNISIDIKGSELHIHMSDDGPGIDPSQHELIFRRYAQVKNSIPEVQRSKHGLGLAGARIIARCLGGDITLNSRKGEGADFLLKLPVPFNK